MSIDDLTLDSFVTSDHHFGHDNIIRFQQRPIDHERIMFDRWCETIGENDTVLHLGDLVCFEHRREEEREHWTNLITNLTGNKKIILGNHDKHSYAWYQAAGWTVLGRGDKPFFWHRNDNGKIIAFSHEPMGPDDGGWNINIHGHIHANTLWPIREDNRQRLNVSVEITDYWPVRIGDVLDTDYVIRQPQEMSADQVEQLRKEDQSCACSSEDRATDF